MKRALLVALILAPLNLRSQDIVQDSAQYVNTCACERSILRYKDFDRRQYHVFFDRERDEFFLLKRERDYFRKKLIDWKTE